MGLPVNIWEKIRRGEYPQTDAGLAEVICSVGRQLAFRLEKLIDVLESGPEEPEEGILPISGPGVAYTPIGRMVELMRLDLASYPRDHSVMIVENTGTLLVTNSLSYSIPLLITNLDNAQLLYYGASPAAITNAPVIEPESSKKIILSPNRDLRGIVAGADINVAISNLDLPTV